MRKKLMSAKLTDEEFEKRFDKGEDVESLGFDLSKGVVDRPEVKRINVDFPVPILRKLDRAAERRGITRQALIKTWLVDRLDEERSISA